MLNYFIGEVKNEESCCGDRGNQNNQDDATKANETPEIHPSIEENMYIPK